MFESPEADARGDAAWVTLDDATVDELRQVGIVGEVVPGDVLYRAGESIRNFFVVLDGEVEIVREGDGADVVVVVHGANRFVGEFGLLTEQRAFLTARVTQPGRILAVQLAIFRELMSTRPELSDTVFERVRRAARDTAQRCRRGRDPYHRLAVLARGDGAPLVREPQSPAAHVDRPRGSRRRAGVPREHRRPHAATCRW